MHKLNKFIFKCFNNNNTNYNEYNDYNYFSLMEFEDFDDFEDFEKKIEFELKYELLKTETFSIKSTLSVGTHFSKYAFAEPEDFEDL